MRSPHFGLVWFVYFPLPEMAVFFCSFFLVKQHACIMCRISSTDGASGEGLLYLVQDFERKRCFRRGIVVLSAGFRAQMVLPE
ncbi:hypothetical protein PWYN_09525 [Paenibacillus wynnii]|uniref:Uncharacterized protein n=1 Tax=Paenibacillus wynnii TaxID=268407 RepID=A0A098MBX3_9BACL|nr:hypothetical protein PWYN_09525 [Paenibacillus wynnii]